jgi:DNA-binding NarL/FixJ family response regulator
LFHPRAIGWLSYVRGSRLNGIEATRQLRSILPDCEILIVSQHNSSEMVREVLKAGARGYVVKGSLARDLMTAIDKVCLHQYFFDLSILDKLPSTHTDLQQILQRSAAFEKALLDSEQRLRNLAQYQSVVMNNMAEGLYALGSIEGRANRGGELEQPRRNVVARGVWRFAIVRAFLRWRNAR